MPFVHSPRVELEATGSGRSRAPGSMVPKARSPSIRRTQNQTHHELFLVSTPWKTGPVRHSRFFFPGFLHCSMWNLGFYFALRLVPGRIGTSCPDSLEQLAIPDRMSHDQARSTQNHSNGWVDGFLRPVFFFTWRCR